MAVDVLCLCFVTPRGEFAAMRIGVSKVEKRGRGSFLLDVHAPVDARVRISALPPGYVANWQNVDSGLAIDIVDSRGRPVDHGFALVIERDAAQKRTGTSTKTLPSAAAAPSVKEGG